MLTEKINRNILFAGFVDLLVIGLTFLFSCSLLSINFGINLFAHLVVYSFVVFISVRLSKRLLSKIISSQTWVVTLLVGNATGFLIGACAMVVVQLLFPELRVAATAIIVASFMAFFVLGTVAPLLKMDRPFSH